jgi:hypothetical protein
MNRLEPRRERWVSKGADFCTIEGDLSSAALCTIFVTFHDALMVLLGVLLKERRRAAKDLDAQSTMNAMDVSCGSWTAKPAAPRCYSVIASK